MNGRSAIDSPISNLIPDWTHGLLPWAELALGIWLLSGAVRHLAWIVSIPVLIVFAIHGLLLTRARQSSCGCFGSMTVPPIITLSFDLIVLAIFIRCRPVWCGLSFGPYGRLAFQAAAIGATIMAVVGLFVTSQYGSIGGSLLVARGQSVLIEPSVLRLPELEANQTTHHTIAVRNHSNEPVDVVLMEANCRCAVARNLPLNVAPGETAQIEFEFLAPVSPGAFQRACRLSTTVGVFDFAVTGTVKSASASLIRSKP